MISDYEFWLVVRKALLMLVDVIERKWGLPRTAEARKQARLEAYNTDCGEASIAE